MSTKIKTSKRGVNMSRSIDTDGESASMKVLSEGQHFATEAHEEIFLEVNFGIAIKEHAQTGDNEECAKDIKNPIKSFDQGDTNPDHYTAHCQRSENSPDENSML
jgi:hypothetical protein